MNPQLLYPHEHLANNNNTRLEKLKTIIINSAAKRNVSISTNTLDKLLNIVTNVLDIDDKELTGVLNQIIIRLEKHVQNTEVMYNILAWK